MPAIIPVSSFSKSKNGEHIFTILSSFIFQEEPVSLGLSDSASESPMILNARTVNAKHRPGYIAIQGAWIR